MKNIILITILLFICSKAFAIEGIKFKAKPADVLFHSVYETKYCKTAKCLKMYTPAYTEKLSQRVETMILNEATNAILQNLILRGLNPVDSDFITKPSHYELLDLMLLDFSSAGGDEPLTAREVTRVMRLISQKDVFTAIIGVVTDEGISEYLVIYNPLTNKVSQLERAQFNKKKSN